MTKRDRNRRRAGADADGAKDDSAQTDDLRPDEPSGWRDVMSTDYSYPDELDDLGRNERRKAKRSWRRDDHAQRMAWLRDQRRTEPTSPVTVIVVVVILAIIVLGFGGGLPRLLGRDDSPEQDVGLLAPSPQPERPAPTGDPSQNTPSAVLTPSTSVSTPPILTERPSAVATSAATDVIAVWARTFYTRDPSAESYADLVTKTGPYITNEVGESLTEAGDSTYEALKTDGGKSTVADVTVTAPRPDSAPVDTPTRISRLVTITIDITGKRPNRIQLPLVVTMIPEGAVWVVSDLNGGAGP
ncbi:hypothetical protein [Kribbella italica]|uniref:Uncharacterized protein n=1 Tax=Kribbella italica TaxID=1540520 RepID=A0A7W9J2F8_9ACTN|nr:hypothetical protein [Kribbella italica]MBB5833890.1 hypothetical protein [Kribbella italica]